MWVTVDEVKTFHGLKPINLNFKEDPTSFEDTITEWILQSQSLIIEYTNNFRVTPDENIPKAVKNVCLRLVSNMVTMATQRRDTPIIKVNDWTIQPTPSDIFTEDLKEDLEPFMKDRPSGKADKIDIFALTGDDRLW